MSKNMIAGCAALLLALGCARTGSAAVTDGPAEAPGSYDLRTKIVEEIPSAGEYDGALQLRVAPDGIISGYYRPDDNAHFIPVTGGTTGGKFWLDIDAFAGLGLHFTGTFANGKIDADSPPVFLDDGRPTGLHLTGLLSRP